MLNLFKHYILYIIQLTTKEDVEFDNILFNTIQNIY